MPRMKNPKFSQADEDELERAERAATRATIYELGVAEYLKNHMPCDSGIEVAQSVLAESLGCRKVSRVIRAKIGSFGSKRKPILA